MRYCRIVKKKHKKINGNIINLGSGHTEDILNEILKKLGWKLEQVDDGKKDESFNCPVFCTGDDVIKVLENEQNIIRSN
jgi:hypothetical protein